MKASDDNPAEGQDEGWDEEVLVWNATVVRIPAPAVQQNTARDAAAVEGGGAERESRSER